MPILDRTFYEVKGKALLPCTQKNWEVVWEMVGICLCVVESLLLFPSLGTSNMDPIQTNIKHEATVLIAKEKEQAYIE